MSVRTTHQRALAPRNAAARERLRERERKHDELLAQIEARQRAVVEAANERRRQRYESVYAATFARLRGWPTRASYDNADHFARREAEAAASREG